MAAYNLRDLPDELRDSALADPVPDDWTGPRVVDFDHATGQPVYEDDEPAAPCELCGGPMGDETGGFHGRCADYENFLDQQPHGT